MMSPNPRLFAPVLGVLLLAVVVPVLAARTPAPPPVSFERDVRPVLKTYCFDCHGGGEKLQGNLDLRLKRFIERGGSSGRAIVPRKPAQSLLLRRLRAGEMPPTEKKVPPEKIAVIER